MPWHLQHLAAGCTREGSRCAGGLQFTVTLPLFPQALLPVLAKRGIVPNLQTFCSLAIGCRRPDDGLHLLSDMRVSGPRLRRPQGWGGVGASRIPQASVLRVSSRGAWQGE